VDEDLYGGFVDDTDRAVLARMIELPPEELVRQRPRLRDGRLDAVRGAAFVLMLVHHLAFFGLLAAGKPLSAFFRDEVATPLGLDFHIGLPDRDEPRVAPMIASDPSEVNFKSRFFKAVTTEPGSLPQRR
jgi:CubicO group peptidase (beta-lactamase class C family)